MARNDTGNNIPSVNPATGVQTPTLPTVTTRNDGNIIINQKPVAPPRGSKYGH